MEIENVMDHLAKTGFSLNFTTGGVGLLVYILQALTLYTVAKRRGIHKPWLAWIPLANVWILGSVSDQYQYVVKGQVKNKRKILLGLDITIAVIASLITAVIAWMVIDFLGALRDFPGTVISEPADILDLLVSVLTYNIGLLVSVALLSIPMAVIAIIQAVYFWMAMYDLFRSCDPNNSTLYLVLSLLGNFVVAGVYGVFMILCRDKDLGMPPRKPAAVPPREPIQEPWETVEE